MASCARPHHVWTETIAGELRLRTPYRGIELGRDTLRIKITVAPRGHAPSEVVIDVELRAGQHSARAYGCDLSYDYVKLNADYTSLLVEAPGGGIAKDDRLGNYSPAFKRALLVEALSYISKFRGKRCVIKYGGAAMTRDSLKRSFCDDVLLLHSVGLLPVVVHGGGPELTRALDKNGGQAEFIDGIRVTPEDDMRVVEMVQTGQINIIHTCRIVEIPYR